MLSISLNFGKPSGPPAFGESFDLLAPIDPFFLVFFLGETLCYFGLAVALRRLNSFPGSMTGIIALLVLYDDLNLGSECCYKFSAELVIECP